MENSEIVGVILSAVGAIGGVGLLRHFLIRGIDSIIISYKNESERKIEDIARFNEQKYNDACKLIEYRFETIRLEVKKLNEQIKELYERTNEINSQRVQIEGLKEDIKGIEAECRKQHRGG